jgi:hypothetical protein
VKSRFHLKLAYVVGVASLLAFTGREARAQDEPAPATLDVTDLWNRLRHKTIPNDDQGRRDYREPMKAWAPVLGAKPSARQRTCRRSS